MNPMSTVLSDVVAYVEVKSSLGTAALAITSRLETLGATVARTLTSSVTHVVFHKGSDFTYRKALKFRAHIVSPAWVKACHNFKFKVSERAYHVSDENDLLSAPENPHSQPKLIAKQSNDVVHVAVKPSRKLPALTIPKEVVKFFERTETNPTSWESPENPWVLKPEETSDENQFSDMPALTSNQLANNSAEASPSSTVIPPQLSPVSTISTDSNIILATPIDNHTTVKHLTSVNPDRGSILRVDGTNHARDQHHSDGTRNRKHSRQLPRLSPGTPLTPDLLLNFVHTKKTPNTVKCNKRVTSKASSTTPSERKKPVVRVTARMPAATKRDHAGNPEKASVRLLDSHTPVAPAPRTRSQSRRSRIVFQPTRLSHNTRKSRRDPNTANEDTQSHDAVSKSSPIKSQTPSRSGNLRELIVSVFNFAVDLDESRRQSGTNIDQENVQPPVEYPHNVPPASSTSYCASPKKQLPSDGNKTHKSRRSSLHIKPLNTRNSLEEFDLRQLPFPKTVDSSCDARFPVILFTGFKRNVEISFHKLLASSSLRNYELLSPPDESASVPRHRSGYSHVKQCSHLVSVDPFRRTPNLLRGLLLGVPIVSDRWITESVGCGTWLDELLFRPAGLPRESRTRTLHRLFSTLGPIHVSLKSNESRDMLRELLELGGAMITNHSNQANFIIGPDASARIPCVKSHWVFDCILQAQLLPTKNYLFSS